MENELIQKAQELRKHGFTTGEIADELNVSMDTARWLTLQKPRDEKPEAPVDFAINWQSLGGNSTRLRYVSGALSDMALSHGEADVIVGIAVSGIPFEINTENKMTLVMVKELLVKTLDPLKVKKL